MAKDKPAAQGQESATAQGQEPATATGAKPSLVPATEDQKPADKPEVDLPKVKPSFRPAPGLETCSGREHSLVTVLDDGKVKFKVFCSCRPDPSGKFVRAMRDARPETTRAVYDLANRTGLGCEKCLAVLSDTETVGADPTGRFRVKFGDSHHHHDAGGRPDNFMLINMTDEYLALSREKHASRSVVI